MRLPLALTTTAVALLLASVALAQDPPPPVAATSSATASAPAPVAPGLVVAPAFVCTEKDTRGIPEADAATASDLLCRELSRASGNRGAFDVAVRPLGRVVVVTVSRAGSADSRSVNLDNLSDITVAAPRLAESLISGQTLADTRRVETVLSTEARAPQAISGQRHIALGIIGVGGVGTATMAGGMSFGYLYELPRWSFGGHLDVAGSSKRHGRQDGMTYAAFGASVRHFLSDQDFAPFVGVGASLVWLSTEGSSLAPSNAAVPYQGYDYVSRDVSTLAPFVEGGLSGFRTTRARFVASVRVEAPLQSLSVDSYGAETTAANVYMLPVSLRLGVQF